MNDAFLNLTGNIKLQDTWAAGVRLGYLVAPTLGLHLESQTIAEAFGAMPDAAKIGIKGILALPFTYHAWNGIRHLIWDTGKMLDMKGVYTGGYVVLGLTGLSTIYLAFA